MRVFLTAAMLSTCVLAACGGTDARDVGSTVSPAADGGVPSGGSGGGDGGAMAPDSGVAPGPSVQAGTGDQAYAPITEGEVLPLIEGSQSSGRFGGYHIWAGVRVVGYEPTGIQATFSFLNQADRSTVVSTRRRLSLQPDGDGFVAFHVSVPFEDCCAVRGAALILHTEVTDSAGLSGSGEVGFMAGPTCAGPGGADICP